MGKTKPINLKHLDKDVRNEIFFVYFSARSWNSVLIFAPLFYSILDRSFPSKSIHVDNDGQFFSFEHHSLVI